MVWGRSNLVYVKEEWWCKMEGVHVFGDGCGLVYCSDYLAIVRLHIWYIQASYCNGLDVGPGRCRCKQIQI